MDYVSKRFILGPQCLIVLVHPKKCGSHQIVDTRCIHGTPDQLCYSMTCNQLFYQYFKITSVGINLVCRLCVLSELP